MQKQLVNNIVNTINTVHVVLVLKQNTKFRPCILSEADRLRIKYKSITSEAYKPTGKIQPCIASEAPG